VAIKGIPTAVLVAPDAFKGTLSARQVADALGRGLAAGGREAWLMPVADGGEGTLDALSEPLRLERIQAQASDPLGRVVEAEFGLGDGVAVVEVAAASGYSRVTDQERDAIAASSFGTGELIVAAVRAGATHIYVAAGGSAMTDGGTAAVRAIELAGGLRGAKLTVLCDARITFVDAAPVFAPQKGADAEQVKHLSGRLDAQAYEYAKTYGRDPRGIALGGAAGGLAGGLWAACEAELVGGAPFVLNALGFDERMRAAYAVLTGEGRLDRQSLVGKAVGEVATRARQTGVPCHAVVGQNRLDAFDQRILDLQLILEAGTVEQLEHAGERLSELL
jgi:glycerate kinase